MHTGLQEHVDNSIPKSCMPCLAKYYKNVQAQNYGSNGYIDLYRKTQDILHHIIFSPDSKRVKKHCHEVFILGHEKI
jgi:hypothetical protein